MQRTLNLFKKYLKIVLITLLTFSFSDKNTSSGIIGSIRHSNSLTKESLGDKSAGGYHIFNGGFTAFRGKKSNL